MSNSGHSWFLSFLRGSVLENRHFHQIAINRRWVFIHFSTLSDLVSFLFRYKCLKQPSKPWTDNKNILPFKHSNKSKERVLLLLLSEPVRSSSTLSSQWSLIPNNTRQANCQPGGVEEHWQELALAKDLLLSHLKLLQASCGICSVWSVAYHSVLSRATF